VDTGMGLSSVAGELGDLIDKPVIAVATHGPDFRAVIEADDGAVIMVEWHGYGAPTPRNAGRSSGQCFISPTASPTAGSTTRSASASAKCVHRAIHLRLDPIWSWMWPS
jgi:hypothetical protein